jgi:hypothetical protein
MSILERLKRLVLSEDGRPEDGIFSDSGDFDEAWDNIDIEVVLSDMEKFYASMPSAELRRLNNLLDMFWAKREISLGRDPHDVARRMWGSKSESKDLDSSEDGSDSGDSSDE